MTTKEKEEFLDNFLENLQGEGDVFWGTGSTTKDFDTITSAIKQQGYWAGNSVRYMYSKDLRFEGIQQRMFGS